MFYKRGNHSLQLIMCPVCSDSFQVNAVYSSIPQIQPVTNSLCNDFARLSRQREDVVYEAKETDRNHPWKGFEHITTWSATRYS